MGLSEAPRRGLHETHIERGLCKAPKSFTKLLYRQVFAKVQCLQKAPIERGLYKPLIGFMNPLIRGAFPRPLYRGGFAKPLYIGWDLTWGHVINFPFMAQRRSELIKDFREDCSCWYLNILCTKHPCKAFVKPLYRGIFRKPLYRGWVFVKHPEVVSQSPYREGLCKASRVHKAPMHRGLYKVPWSFVKSLCRQWVFTWVIWSILHLWQEFWKDQYLSKSWTERTVLAGTWTSYTQSVHVRGFVRPQ